MPTHNRAHLLGRAIDSALSQTHGHLELIISDNASTDETEAVCRAAAAADRRIRYVRHGTNIGPTANFNYLFGECRGDYVLMLADDDWLDPGYVAACLSALQADRSVVLAAGLSRYYRGDAYIHDGVSHEHSQPESSARIIDYFARVRDNGIFYGLMRRNVLARAGHLPNVLGNDWLHVARIAYQGKIQTLETVHIHRELGGTSTNVETILATFGGAPWLARIPQIGIAWHVLRDIGWGNEVYESTGPGSRIRLALRAAFVSIRWPDLAWHLATPLVASLSSRPHGRAIWNLYLRITRAVGAGRQPH